MGFTKKSNYKKNKSKKKMTTDQKASMALSLAKKLGSEIERKFSVTTNYNQTVSYLGTIVNLSGSISQNTGDINNRIGDNIVCYYLHLRFNFYLASISANYTDTIRVIVYYDYNNSIVSADDILQIGAGDQRAPLSRLNQDYKTNFRILGDKTYVVDSATFLIKQSNFNMKLKDLKTQYSGATVTPTHGAIKFLVISRQDAFSVTKMDYYASLYYTDV